MKLQTTGMEFASEMVIKATLMRLRIEEVPTTLDKDGRSRPPHLRPWRDGWRHLRFMLLFSPRWLFFYPGVLLTTVALALGLALLPGPIHLSDRVALDVQTLLFASAGVHLGVQMVSFALCARVYALRAGLLLESPDMEGFTSKFTLELGLLAGGVLCLLGLGGAVANVLHWSAVGFGQLDARQALRAGIPAASALGLGSQVMATSFLLSILSMRWRR
jgi:hypothetical protein